MHFRLYRETFYLAIHYLDRYLSLSWGLSRDALQLIGIAALFVAAKLEVRATHPLTACQEIYPPKIKEFAEVCAGSCSTEAIFETELSILMAIQWKLSVPTVYYWLSSYLELLQDDFSPEGMEALRESCLELIDLATHLPLSLMFTYSLIAASALYIRLQNGGDWQIRTDDV